MATIYDVAQMAGVSPATVSRVLNNSTLVRDETRQNVLAAVAKLGYQRAESPETERGGRNRTLAVLVSDVANPTLARMIKGVQSVAFDAGFGLIVGDFDGELSEELAFITRLRERSIDGLIWSSPHLRSEHVARLRSLGVPFVLAFTYVTEIDVSSVYVDNVEAAFEVLIHLFSQGHERIGIIRGPLGDATNSQQRLQGCELAFKSRGLRLSPEYIVDGDFSIEGGYEAARALLAKDPRPTAIFAFSDTMALGALRAAEAARLAVPDQLSVIGFDDIALAGWSSPALSTVSQPAFEIGREAAECLLKQLSDAGQDAVKKAMPHRLTLRRSSGPAPVSEGGGGRPTSTR